MNDKVNAEVKKVELDAKAIWNHIEAFFEHLLHYTPSEKHADILIEKDQLHALVGSEAPDTTEKPPVSSTDAAASGSSASEGQTAASTEPKAGTATDSSQPAQAAVEKNS